MKLSELLLDILIVVPFCKVIDHSLIIEILLMPPSRLHVNSEFSPSNESRDLGISSENVTKRAIKISDN